ncbi:MAG TPA: outer membrane lipoprotein-sorting protein [Vicinamibacterales bacterium]|nr:outer membrane lipoprotein-sorting protein [Vicinamibacterales bacterium]
MSSPGSKVQSPESRVQSPKSGVWIAAALLPILFASHGYAQSDARQIMAEAQRRSEAKSQRYEGLLQVLDGGGKVADKRWSFVRLGSHGSSKAVLRFLAPAEVKGVALLIVNHPDRASDQWMWTPALQRERRIALQDRSTRFFGTDFSFEDLEERDVDQYDYRLLGEQPIDGAACWRIESVPSKRKTSQYTRSEVWIRKDNYAFAQIESYVKAELVRRLTYSHFAQLQGIWTARRLEMSDLRRKSRTILTLEKLEYNVPLRDEDFTLQSLRNPL